MSNEKYKSIRVSTRSWKHLKKTSLKEETPITQLIESMLFPPKKGKKRK